MEKKLKRPHEDEDVNSPKKRKVEKKRYGIDKENMDSLPEEIKDVILSFWLPLHWLFIFPSELKRIEKWGYFGRRVYIQNALANLDAKEEEWYVDRFAMAYERSHPGVNMRPTACMEKHGDWPPKLGAIIWRRNFNNGSIWNFYPRPRPPVIFMNPKNLGDSVTKECLKCVYSGKVDSATWKTKRDESNFIVSYRLRTISPDGDALVFKGPGESERSAIYGRAIWIRIVKRRSLYERDIIRK